MQDPSLYGIVRSNRGDADHWGKNTFNSSFPTALACWMRDQGIPAVGLALRPDLTVETREMPFDHVFGTSLLNSRIIFDFESKYDPYQQYAYDDIKGIDLVVRSDDGFCRALEIKLTVVPDNTTANWAMDSWGAELVLRPASTSYAILGMAHSLRDNLSDVRAYFEPVCSRVRDWTNKSEMQGHLPSIVRLLDNFQAEFCSFQIPFLMQPIWRTQRKSAVLTEKAFDVFVWTDFALARLFVDSAKTDPTRITRPSREAIRMAKALYDLSTRGKFQIEDIYTGISLGFQTDKACSFPGRVTNRYMRGNRLSTPAVARDALPHIILNGGERELSPERRFDQTIYFTAAMERESDSG